MKEKKNRDDHDIKKYLKKNEGKQEKDMLERVLEIMEEYDIKHPLRGDKYAAYTYK